MLISIKNIKKFSIFSAGSDTPKCYFFKLINVKMPTIVDYPRWPSGVVIKNSINTKMTISQEPLVEIDPTLCQNVSCMKPF